MAEPRKPTSRPAPATPESSPDADAAPAEEAPQEAVEEVEPAVADTVKPRATRGRRTPAEATPSETQAEADEADPEPPTETVTAETEVIEDEAAADGSATETEDEAAADADDEGDPEGVSPDNPAARRGPSRQRGLRAALASLPVPEPGPSFWADIDRTMAEQPPLAISARPAIRPISEPPPLSQPSLNDLGSTAILITDDSVIDDDELGFPPDDRYDRDRDRYGDDDFGGRDRPHGPPVPVTAGLGEKQGSPRTVAVVAAIVVVLVLVVGSALGSRGGDDPSGADTTSSTLPGETTVTTAKPVTTPPGVPGLDAAARLAPSGLGPLRIGGSLRDLTAAGIRVEVDQRTFETSSHACYDVRLPGAQDLVLRFRSPDPDEGVADAQDGVLAYIGIAVAPVSLRVTENGLHVGSTEDEVRAALDAQENTDVEVTDHPTNPGGHVFVAQVDDGTDMGVAYGTNGSSVVEIAVGYVDAITQRQGCR
jgi:hypothetical protein